MLQGHGAPNTGVVGNVGDYFEDLDTGIIYKLATIVLKEKQMGFVTIPEYVCETNQYVWVPVVDGGDCDCDGDQPSYTTSTDDDVFVLLVETGLVTPLTDSNGAIYTDNEGRLFTL